MSALLALLLLAPSPRAAAAADSREVALVASPQALAAAEEGGLSLGELLDGPASRGFSNSLLAARRRYASMVRVLEADARELRGAPLAFDPGWLRSPAASFELVGIAPRLDLAEPGTCGEIRLVYRLAYARDSGDARKPARWRGDPTLAYPPARVDPRAPSTRRVASRLPMTLNVVLKAWDERGKADCPRLARRWLAPAGLSGPRLGAWLVSTAGPLPPATVSPARLREVQVNLQLGRWPAQDRQDMGGQYENLLRTFAPDYLGKDLIPAPLANTLDPARLARDRRLRDELRAWISGKENLAAIERGDARVPEKFLATRAVSVS
ncbi:MAG TPA: hypothetical protein VNI01_14510, partial [Elusimicrobiota bacterium]|nr:hypothetical protein [Elusimicrobiota bacterium]